jgi:Flp pilus assembly pilin Flp
MAQLLMRALLSSEAGQDFAEYALLIAMIALLVIVAITAYGGSLSAYWAMIAASLP